MMALELTDSSGKTEYFYSMADLAALRAELYKENEANQALTSALMEIAKAAGVDEDAPELTRKTIKAIEILRTLASSRAGDYATLLAENARLTAEAEAAEKHLDHIAIWCSQPVAGLTNRGVADAVMRMCDDYKLIKDRNRDARLTRADGDG